VLGPDGAVAGEPTIFARYIGEGRGSIADLKLQPDGLYFTDLYLDDGDGGATAPGGTVWRIRHVGEAAFTASAIAGPGPLTVSFADTSTLAGAAAWRWDFGDGATSTERGPTHTFAQPGRYAVSLTVTAADGTAAEHLMLIAVADQSGSAPTPEPATRDVPAAPAPATIFFPETGMGLGGGFKHFWEQHGGLATFGYPITDEFREVSPTDGQTYTVQYFERARFEYHPEHQGTPHETQLGLLGRELTAHQSHDPPFQPVPDPGDGTWFTETGHTLRGSFHRAWAAMGGTAIYGLPISERFEEKLPDGKVVLMQYFERGQLTRVTKPVESELRPARLGTIRFVRRPAPRPSP
jgi:hypothetical protein